MSATVTQPSRRLISISAAGVLGEYDHAASFTGGRDFTIVYGPNGVGKTRFLEIAEALSELSVSKLSSLPFRDAKLEFSDGYTFAIVKTLVEPAPRDSAFENVPDVYDLYVTLTKPNGDTVESKLGTNSDFESWLARSTPWHPLGGENLWQNELDGDLATARTLKPRYNSQFRHDTRQMRLRDTEKEVEQEVRDFAKSLNIKLIETQRLTAVNPDTERSDRYGFVDASRPIPTIRQHSEQIRELLNANLSENSRLTQRLDSTFPRRMLERGSRSTLTEDELRGKWTQQTTRRSRLTEIADLNVDPDLSLPEGELNEWQLGMLELYLEDADAKLDSFSDVLKKINLLEEVVNARLLGKRLNIDANHGLVVTRMRDEASIALPSLSSGEQHEIILLFDLLFNVARGSVVLIDEPEISLHIGWQKKFVADVLRVSELVGFQFLIATHSPQIIDRWWSYANRLGPSTFDFLDEDGDAENAE